MIGLKRLWNDAAALVGGQQTVRKRIGSRWIFIRPRTPDLSVARNCFDGEFTAAIDAARPLKHNFIVDAGGYIGTAAIALAEAFPSARVVSIEPSEDNIAILEKNVAGYPNIMPIKMALTATSGDLQLVDRGTGQWGFSVVPSPEDCESPQLLHSVAGVTIAEIMERFGVTGIDILKLDIEGAEYELLRNAQDWMPLVRVIIAETHDRIVPGCQEAFDRATSGRRNYETHGEKIISVVDD